ncbi:MAG TPA: DUF933 domain-containing protein [Candidatus Megaira endosymbiont of Hartmannula sinica]|nr:DUF933 domain-containing protein [Candidatus Megaera endosymbiont of Hartmannula sinica]
MGLEKTGLDRIINSAYKMLGLESFFTVGKQETRSWSFKQGSNAQTAAGIIHTDFARGFIMAEVISYTEYMQYKDRNTAKEKGLIRMEGKEYLVKDGDIILFRFNV